MGSLSGTLVSGLGKASDFTRLDWVRGQLIELAGIDPHPGTFNLAITGAEARTLWQHWRSAGGEVIQPGDPAFCSARCYPARIGGRVPAAIVVPDVPGYPEEKLELVAALHVRDHLSLAEGQRIDIELCQPLRARAVLFDIDGTMVDSIDAYHEVARRAAEPLGLTVTAQHVRNALATGSNFWKAVVPDGAPDCDAVRKQLTARAVAEWPAVLREHCHLFDGLAQTLDALKQAGMLLGIVSGARPEVLELLKSEAILERFDAVFLGADVSRRKPHPEGLLKCLERLDVAPQEAIYVGDTQVDILASRAAGVQSIGVLTGAADCATLTACWPDRLVSSHSRLPAVIHPAE